MENLLEDRNEISAQLWRLWEEKDKRHHKAIVRKIQLIAGVVIGLLTLIGTFYSFAAR